MYHATPHGPDVTINQEPSVFFDRHASNDGSGEGRVECLHKRVPSTAGR